jgi:hypothetical protein
MHGYPSKVVYGICDIQSKSVPISVLRGYTMVLVVKNVLFALLEVIAKQWYLGLNIKMYTRK